MPDLDLTAHPLTAAQRGLWFAQQLDPASPAYNIAEYADVHGPVDTEALRRAVRHVVREYEALRVTFAERDGTPFQLVHPQVDIDLPVVDLTEEGDPAGEALMRMREELARPADTATGPLVRVVLYRLAADRFLFHQQVHHLALDGYGAALALVRIAEVYSLLAEDPSAQVPLRPAPLGPVLDAEREYRTSETIAADREFWSGHMAGLPEPVGLRDGSAIPAHRFHLTSAERDAGWVTRLKDAARTAGAGWPTLFIGAVATYLHRVRGVGEVVLGLPVTGRRTDVARTTPTMLSNVLPLRVAVSPSDRVDELLRRVSKEIRTVLKHQRYPAEDLRRDRGLLGRRERLTGPVVNVLAFDDTLAFGAATAMLHNLSIGPVEDFVVAAHASFADGGLRLDILGNPELHTEEELRCHRDLFLRLLEAFVTDPMRELGSIGLLEGEERDRVVGLGAGPEPQTEGLPEGQVTLPEQLARQARRNPEETAVVSGTTHLSFAALEQRVDQLARRLVGAGSGPGTRVAVALPRSTDLVVALLAAMRAGAAYLPIDPSYPVDRIAYMLSDSAPIALVADAATARRIDPEGRFRLVEPAAQQHALTALAADLRPTAPGGHDAAYVLYTSGSTGQPKGVVVEHRSLSNLLEHHRRESHACAVRSLGRRLRVALTAATSFDASWDPVLWMAAGHELHIVDDSVRRDPEALVDFLTTQRIDAIETTPTYLQQLLAAGLLEGDGHQPRVIALGGEAVNDALWNHLADHPNLMVFNFYGPTETTVNAVTSRIAGGTPVIGRPVTGARAYVLDSGLHPLPVGTAGELYLSGEGVARGYAGRPGLTADRFLADPFGAPGGRMYRTGDLARWREDGSLEFLGRSDRQVKVRGFRVETGEVESALTSVPGVVEAAVALHTTPGDLELLAAYLVIEESAVSGQDPAGGAAVDLAALRARLSQVLPEHMVPAAYARVDRLPLTPNGKLDTAALPEPQVASAGTGAAPRTPRERELCALFAAALGVQSVGRDDDFFALGGHSLLATAVVGRIRSAFGVELPIRALFESPTPAGLVGRLSEAAPARQALTRAEPRPARVPLSFSQHRLWLLERMGEGGAAYHIPVALRLSGALDLEAVRAALQDVVGRHESLRTVFPEDEHGPCQQVKEPHEARLPLKVVPAPHGLPDEAGRQQFSLTDGLPVRAELFTVGADEHILLLTFHHIAADGWSMGPLMRDLADAFAARTAGRAPVWEPLPVQYADYSLWQRETLGDAEDPDSPLAGQLAHWTSALEGLPSEVTFPVDRLRPACSGGGGGVVPLAVDAATHAEVARLARESGTSTFMVIHAALSALLTRLGAGHDIVIGTPVAGRTDEALTELVGFFVNTLALRVDLTGDPTFRELLGRVRESDLAAYAHQEVPFERLVEELRPTRSLARHPLFQVMLSLNNTEKPRLDLPGLHVRHEASLGRTGAKFDLTWDLAEHHDQQGRPDGLTGELEYSTDLFEHSSAERFAGLFLRLLSAALREPGLPVTDLDFLEPEQRLSALDSRASATGEGARTGTITDVLTTQAVVDPTRTAVVDARGSLSFGDLLTRSERLAARLHRCGVRPGDRVASALPRTATQIEALFGVMRCGAVHVPLDPSHPRERNRLILDTARPSRVLAVAETVALLPQGDHRFLLLDDPNWQDSDPGCPPPAPGPRDAAYVLYTSGSTGTPKGVVVEHRALVNLLAGHREQLIAPAEAANGGRPLRVALTAAATFDASWDPLLWMAAGHELHLVDDATRRDPEALTAFLHEHRVDVLETTPTFLEQLRGCGLFAPGRPGPRVLALGGEAVNEGLWNELAALTDVAVWNLYGPTEATVDSVISAVTPGSPPSIGHAVAGMRARVLDGRLRPVAPGVTGELYLSGTGLARGYENRPGLTAQSFLADPYGAPGGRMYRTGDLVRRRPDDSLQFVGRRDDQVKVRGFRVETGEVEAVLAGQAGVAQAAVAVRPDASGAGRLVAWIVAEDGAGPDPADVRSFAAGRLPDYMVPSAVATVSALPLTVHGKIDAEALPDPLPASDRDGEPPQSAQEEILCALFAECLGVPSVGRNGDFFDLGGHSLLATRVVSRIRAAFGAELPVRALFEARTPAGLAPRLGDAGVARPALRPASRAAGVPLSYAQQRLWFLHRMDPDDPVYNIPIAVRLTGSLDRTALRSALGDVLVRHESLRTVFTEAAGGDVVQTVLDPGDARIGMTVTETTDAALGKALRTAAALPFDLTRELPLRAELFTTAADRHVLLLTAHHIAADGWSMGPLAKNLADAFAARTAGRAPVWEPLPVQYADYSLWQRDLLGSTEDAGSLLSRQLSFWKSALEDIPEETALPVDRLRPARWGGGGGVVPLAVDAATHAEVARLARESGTSTFMVIHAALSALLTRLGAGHDIVIGTPVAGRTDEALTELVGFFVNTLALRVDLTGDPTFRELLGRVRESDLAAYAHQEVPFERLVEELRPTRSLARHPLFQVMLSLNNTEKPRLDLPGLHAELEGVDTGGAKFDLSFSLTERPGGRAVANGLEGTLEFSRDLFEPATAHRIADRFVRLLAHAVGEPDTPVSAVPLLTEAESKALLAAGDGGTSGAGHTTIVRRFADTVAVARSRDLAVTAPDGRLSFPELDAGANRLAHWLQAQGVAAGDTVAVLLPRSTDSLVVLLGVLKAGAVYAPVDTGLPQRRVEAVLADARPTLVLSAQDANYQLPQGTALVQFDGSGTAAAIAAQPCTEPPGAPLPSDAAYLLHTSGSTGRPKGVLVEHRSLARLFDHHRRQLFTPAARAAGSRRLRIGLTASLSFDASWDPILWMVAGHDLHIVDELTRRDPEALVALVRRDELDVLETTPTHARQLLDAGLFASDAAHRPSVLALGGEAVPSALWTELRAVPGLTCWNLYGPTEATVNTLEAPLCDTLRPVLGVPVTGTRAYVLDARLGPAPTGVIGELYLAGDSLARGYAGQPGETSLRFLPDPYGPAGDRMYRTGDLARWNSADELEFAGRADGQVKVRGFRVEPEEIAAVLERDPRVAGAAVVLAQDDTTGGRLLAYVVPAPGSALAGAGQSKDDGGNEGGGAEVAALREHASRFLPDYMVPSGWAVLDRLPLTSSGKLDRRALPMPEAFRQPVGRGPRNPREDVLCTLFAEALGRERIGADEDFFALGGHSLLATRLIGRVREVLGVELTIRALFESPTVEALAVHLDHGETGDPLATLLPLRTGGELTPLFCFHPAGGLAWSYAGLLEHLEPGRPLYGLQSPGLRGGSGAQSLMDLARTYLDAIRSVQPHGPYLLLGWSFGGNTAHETAVQLREAGEEVELLALLDSYPTIPDGGLDSTPRDTVFRELLTHLGLDTDAETLHERGATDARAVRELLAETGSPLGALEPETIDAMVDDFAAHTRLLARQQPRVFDGDILFFTATEGRPLDLSGTELWAPYVTGRIDEHDVPYPHAQLMQPVSRAQIGSTTAAILRELRRP